MADRRDTDDALWSDTSEGVQEQTGEEVMARIVHAEVLLESLDVMARTSQ
jgi:hypothetical protein